MSEFDLFYDPIGLVKDIYDATGDECGNPLAKLYTESATEKMRIKQSYADTFPKLFICYRCGGNQFNVASEEHFTAIRCPKCLWELCVHDG